MKENFRASVPFLYTNLKLQPPTSLSVLRDLSSAWKEVVNFRRSQPLRFPVNPSFSVHVPVCFISRPLAMSGPQAIAVYGLTVPPNEGPVPASTVNFPARVSPCSTAVYKMELSGLKRVLDLSSTYYDMPRRTGSETDILPCSSESPWLRLTPLHLPRLMRPATFRPCPAPP